MSKGFWQSAAREGQDLAWAGRAGPRVAEQQAAVAAGRLQLTTAGGAACVGQQPGVEGRVGHLAAHAHVFPGRLCHRVLHPALGAAPCADCSLGLGGGPLRPARDTVDRLSSKHLSIGRPAREAGSLQINTSMLHLHSTRKSALAVPHTEGLRAAAAYSDTVWHLTH